VLMRHRVLGGVTGGGYDIPGISELDAPHRIVAMLSTGGHVARLLLWPTHQTPDYGPSALPSGMDRTLTAAATVLTIVLFLIWSVRRAWRKHDADARPFVAVVWCLIAYFPASNLLGATGPIIGERTLYLASVGVALLLAWGLEQLLVRIAAVRPHARGATAVVAAACVAVCVRGYVRANDYARVWQSNAAVFSRIVHVDSLNYRGYQLLAIQAKDRKHYDESARLYARAYALRPYDQTLLTDYTGYLLEMHRPRYARAIGERLFRNPRAWSDPQAITLFLNATSQVWGVDSVLAIARRVNARAPSGRASLYIGMAYDLKGDSAAAQAAYRDGLRNAPRDSALAAHISSR
jgi:hypothetical protein